MLMLVA
jgi:hypothetical protein